MKKGTLWQQLKNDVRFLLVEELKELDKKGKIKEDPLTTDYCLGVFISESNLSDEQLKIFIEVYYDEEDYIHDTIESFR